MDLLQGHSRCCKGYKLIVVCAQLADDAALPGAASVPFYAAACAIKAAPLAASPLRVP